MGIGSALGTQALEDHSQVPSPKEHQTHSHGMDPPHKQDPAGEILKWKARLSTGGHCQMFGDTYWTTFAPVVSWTTVRCIFIMALLSGWHMRSIDFVMAYTQAGVKLISSCSWQLAQQSKEWTPTSILCNFKRTCMA